MNPVINLMAVKARNGGERDREGRRDLVPVSIGRCFIFQ